MPGINIAERLLSDMSDLKKKKKKCWKSEVWGQRKRTGETGMAKEKWHGAQRGVLHVSWGFQLFQVQPRGMTSTRWQPAPKIAAKTFSRSLEKFHTLLGFVDDSDFLSPLSISLTRCEQNSHVGQNCSTFIFFTFFFLLYTVVTRKMPDCRCKQNKVILGKKKIVSHRKPDKLSTLKLSQSWFLCQYLSIILICFYSIFFQ